MKKILMLITATTFIFCTSSYAAIQVEYHPDDMKNSDPERSFGGKIDRVEYYPNNSEPRVTVTIHDYIDPANLTISFTSTDLPVGVTLLNHNGETMLVDFADKNFTISSIRTSSVFDSKSK